jgi:hypothetical protein
LLEDDGSSGRAGDHQLVLPSSPVALVHRGELLPLAGCVQQRFDLAPVEGRPRDGVGGGGWLELGKQEEDREELEGTKRRQHLAEI